MARRVFFSFHYENDVWRANVIRNSWLTKPNTEAAGFIDAAAFENVKKAGEAGIKKWINEQLERTSVTVVLIGAETNNREYIKYELQKSYLKGNGLLGIYVHQIKDKNGSISNKGSNHFGEIGKDKEGKPVYFSITYPCYDWIDNDGFTNLGKWVEDAATKVGR